MGEAGVDLVTVGVFSWAQLEPAEGDFLFRLAAGGARPAGRRRDRCRPGHADGIAAALAVYPLPGCPPGQRRRGPLHATGAGSISAFAARCTGKRPGASSSAWPAEVGDHPAVEMWHLSNEYACHVPYCYCDYHAQAFRRLARAALRFGRQALNEAWGTAFWSQRYGDFAEVMPPRMTPTFGNPAQELDYRRFSSEAFLEEALEERAMLRSCRPELPVTTNFMGFFKPLDYFAWASELDVASTDNYTDPPAPSWAMQSAMHYDLVRSVNKEIPWMVMEQTSSRVNWRDAQRGQSPRPNAGHVLPGGRPGRHRSALFPVAGVPGGGGKVPLGHAVACRRGLARVAGSGRPRAASWPGWARSKVHLSRPGWRLFFRGRTGGRWKHLQNRRTT